MAEDKETVAKGITGVASDTVKAMSNSPLVLATTLINIAFLGFAGYVLGEVAESSRERNKVQNDLISNLVRDIRDCRQPRSAPTWWKPPMALPFDTTPIEDK